MNISYMTTVLSVCLMFLCVFSLNSIYFQISIYAWQHTSIQTRGKGIRKEVT